MGKEFNTNASKNNISIEGNPFIIRFKTLKTLLFLQNRPLSIEGNPFIIRFKTS